MPLLVDPEMRAYRAAGLKREAWRVLRPHTMLHLVRALGKGNAQSRVLGDPWQLGGTFVVSPSGEVLFSQVSQEPGDHADPARVLDALR